MSNVSHELISHMLTLKPDLLLMHIEGLTSKQTLQELLSGADDQFLQLLWTQRNNINFLSCNQIISHALPGMHYVCLLAFVMKTLQ